MTISKICLVGDIVVDVTLPRGEEIKVRLGGIVHCARALWALGIPYTVGYFAPEYLDESIDHYLKHHGCIDVTKLGNIKGAPFVFLINEAKEIGDQGYEFLLRETIKVSHDDNTIHALSQQKFDDVLFISGNYDLKRVHQQFSRNKHTTHFDVANNVATVNNLDGIRCETVFISTSSDVFKNNFAGQAQSFFDLFSQVSNTVILKENRGGSRAYKFFDKQIYSADAQTKPIVHSVGVGDVYNVAYLSKYRNHTIEEALAFASWTAMEYASTTFVDDLKKVIERLLRVDLKALVKFKGVSLPWEKRKQINIYIAAPDFDFMDTKHIDALSDSLSYHNFLPRRPIKENGQMKNGASVEEKQELFVKDIEMLAQCQIVVAVLLNNDPGTLVEIGLAKGQGKPVLVYDPHNSAENCMLSQLPDLVTTDLDEIMSKVFQLAQNFIDDKA